MRTVKGKTRLLRNTSSLLEDSIKMFNKALNEMKESGKDTKKYEEYIQNINDTLIYFKNESLLRNGRFSVNVANIPDLYVNKVSFLDEQIKIKFLEGLNFSVEKNIVEQYKKHNYPIKIEYCTSTGDIVRTDLYEVTGIDKMEKSELSYDDASPITIDITFNIKNHDITTNTKGNNNN